MAKPKSKILFALGTRPEALKLAPVILAAKKSKRFRVYVCLTAQHREMSDGVLRLFKIRPDFDLNLMRPGQTLGELSKRIFPATDSIFKKVRPDLLIVQGDTTTAAMVALSASYHKIRIAHVEAGLRSFDKNHPFPEEINRTLISHLADIHFAPTPAAKSNLLREGIRKEFIFVTGNTIVDSLRQIAHPSKNGLRMSKNEKIILVTAHRRENFGKPLRSICHALKEIVRRCPEARIIYPVHLNPNVQKTVSAELSNQKRITLLHPLSYSAFLDLLQKCHLILTDSGGVQEEAPSFGKPVLVLREVTERNEAVRLGMAKVVGASKDKIVRETLRLLENSRASQNMVKSRNPFGDGKASQRIVRTLNRIL